MTPAWHIETDWNQEYRWIRYRLFDSELKPVGTIYIKTTCQATLEDIIKDHDRARNMAGRNGKIP